MFDEITLEMLEQLDGHNRSQYDKIRDIAENQQNFSAEFIATFSEFANSLAVKSHATGTEYKIALPLCKIFEKLLSGKQVTYYYLNTYQQEIYDTKIDLAYASGYHVYASQRLAPYLMAEKLTSNQTSEPHGSIFTPAYA